MVALEVCAPIFYIIAAVTPERGDAHVGRATCRRASIFRFYLQIQCVAFGFAPYESNLLKKCRRSVLNYICITLACSRWACGIGLVPSDGSGFSEDL